MDEYMYASDFEFLYQALQSHPLLITQPQSKDQLREKYKSLLPNVIDLHSLITCASELTSFFEDGHTNIEIPYTSGDKCIPISSRWDENNLVVRKNFEDIPEGSKILAINGQPILHILDMLSGRIPHENIYLVKSRTTSYPYQNYHLFSQMNLQWMFGKSDRYDIDFGVRNKRITKACTLRPYDNNLDFCDDNSITWENRNSSIYLRLDACICSKQYFDALEQIAVACTKSKIHSLILDLSHNMGGDSSVIDAFMKYANAKGYYRYEMIDYSSGIGIRRTARDEWIPIPSGKNKFPKSISCIVSNHTFSSARTFAVTLKDNGIATILGQPTGGKPTSWGMPKRGTLPHSQIRFRVSQAQFLRPNASLDNENALIPDHLQ